MIKIVGLKKLYGEFVAVENLNLQINRGELFGFLGPNGAGKTTTIKMLTGLLKPTAGSILLAGFDLLRRPIAAKAKFGYVPDKPDVFEKLTGREYLDFIADIYNVEIAKKFRRINELLELFELADRDNELIQSYSHGMRQKIAFAGALIHEPDILFLDEPTVGLDPKSARKLKDILEGLCHRGTTVFMSTHIMEIAEKMCDRVGIINRGRLVAVGTLAELARNGDAAGSSLEDVFLEITGGVTDGEVAKFLDEGGE